MRASSPGLQPIGELHPKGEASALVLADDRIEGWSFGALISMSGKYRLISNDDF